MFLGDSGGPLYLWHKDRATLIGVVSRGMGCSFFDHPGIYTRVKKYLNWINDIIWESC